MNILFLIPDFSRGGAQRHLSRHANGLAAHGHRITIAIIGQDRSLESELESEVNLVSLAGRASSPLTFLRFLKAVRTVRPDVVVGWSIYANTLVALGKTVGAIRAAMMVENNYPPRLFSSMSFPRRILSRWIIKTLYPAATLLTANSDEIVDYLRGVVRPTPPLARIRNPIGVTELRALAAKPIACARPDHGLLVAAGRIQNAQKGFDALLNACARLPEDLSWTLWIVGDGPDLMDLKTQAVRLRLDKRIVWCGMQDNPSAYMAAADVVVVPSRFEGFPNVLLEAMALGRATLSTDCLSGPRELTQGGTLGVLVPVDDVEALAKGIEQLLRDPGLRARLGRAASAYVQRAHAQAVVIPQLEALLQEAAQRSAKV